MVVVGGDGNGDEDVGCTGCVDAGPPVENRVEFPLDILLKEKSYSYGTRKKKQQQREQKKERLTVMVKASHGPTVGEKHVRSRKGLDTRAC
ncbi:hypothetical protein HZH66_005494 [Vespula vulgaris]|uniref:Uncharacterized protein n=1 Tax=Vespula vulgaris TaxID=7454 RepID=A0A834N919_VESVU|nr:hypothetical protein HZH66_005494 [Vespula vulgaris]